MNILRTAKGGFKCLINSKYRWLHNARRGKYNELSDKEFLSEMFMCKLGYYPDWDNPMTFNEKLQWLKINYRKPEFTTMVDKYKVRDYIKEKIGEEYLVPLLGVWENADEIDIEKLPEQFVLKTTHGNSSMYICRDKSEFNFSNVKRKLDKSLQDNFYYHVREWPYKNVKPRIIAEKYMQDGKDINLKVYKVFNFNGVPELIQTIQNDKTPYETIDYFDTEWNLLDIRQNYPNSKNPAERPKTLEKMLDLSKKCSEGFPFLRTDWYEVNGKVYFSEFTFYSDAGMEKFHPEKWDNDLGELIKLPEIEQ